MHVSLRKVMALAAVIGFSFAIGVAPAQAATAYSPKGYYGPYAGYSYDNQAVVSNNTFVYAATYVDTQNGGTVPTGYMGALARLYKGSALCKSNGYSYNNGAASGISESTGGSNCGSGTYYSYGASAAYNGNGYNYVYTFKSPNLNY